MRRQMAGLGTELVVQTAYGDSGKTTFFIDDETGWKRHQPRHHRQRDQGDEADQQPPGRGRGGPHSQRHRRRPVHVGADRTRDSSPRTAVAGAATRCSPKSSTRTFGAKAGDLVGRLGDRLGAEGYRGFFEVDVLVDTDTDEVYLGELNPRISGASSITNVTAGAYADVPLFAFHLLEYLDVDFELDVDEINARWRELAAADLWSQMVIKETSPDRAADHRGRADRAVLLRRGLERWSIGGPRWTGTSCRTSPRRSSCESTGPGTTAGRVPTSACWSPRDGCSAERAMGRIR